MFAVGNNLNRAHNYFEDFWKRFSILFKAQQLQLIRKTETNKKRERVDREYYSGSCQSGKMSSATQGTSESTGARRNSEKK